MCKKTEVREYRPDPLCTDGVQIPPEVETLKEMLARNAH